MSSYQEEFYGKEIAPTRINELCKMFDLGGKCLSDEVLAFRKKADSIDSDFE